MDIGDRAKEFLNQRDGWGRGLDPETGDVMPGLGDIFTPSPEEKIAAREDFYRKLGELAPPVLPHELIKP